MSKPLIIDGREFQVLKRGTFREKSGEPGVQWVELISIGDGRYSIKIEDSVLRQFTESKAAA